MGMCCRWGTQLVWEGGQWSQRFSSSSLQVNIETCLFRHFGPQKEKFSQGVTALQLLPSGKFLLGTGEGVVAEVTGAPHFKRLRTARMPGAITSVALRGSGNQVWASHTHTHTHTHTHSHSHTHHPHPHTPTHTHTHTHTHSHCHTRYLFCSSLLAWQQRRCTSLSTRASALL